MNSKMHLKSMALTVMTVAAVASSAEIVHHDDKDFWVDEAGVEHQLFYEKGNSEKLWGLATYADETLTTAAPLTADGILVTLQSETYSGAWPFGFTCYGMDFRKGIGSCPWEKDHLVGAYGIRSEVSGWTLTFYSGSIKLTASQTWSGPDATDLSASPFVVRTRHDTYGYKGAILANEDNLSLTIAGDMRLLIRDDSTDLPTSDVIVKKPAVLSLLTNPKLHARSLTIDGGTGFYFGKKTSSDSYGSIAELSVARVAQTVALTNNASLTAYGSTVVSVTGGVAVVAAAGSESAVVGAYSLKDDATVFRAEAGATLDLTGATLTGGAVSVQGPGTVKYSFDANSTVGGVSFGGGCSLVLSGSGGTIDGSLADVSAIEIVVTGVVGVDDATMASYGGSDIRVSSGVLYIPSASSIPSGVKVVTSGTGALCVRNASGFDVEAQMGGTKSFIDGSSGLIVTDAPREDETIVVQAGETLSVMGSGLAASSTVDLRGGSKIVFYDTATVAASLAATNGAVDVMTTHAAATGTVSGVVNAQGGTFNVESSGLVRFLGGGKLGAFKMVSGAAEVGGANYLGYGSITMVSGHLRLTSLWQFDAKWIDVCLNQTQTGDATLEVAQGGELYLAKANCNVFVGKDTNWKSRLYLNGGCLCCIFNEKFLVNCGIDDKGVKTDYSGNGIVEVDNGGELALARMIRSSTHSGPHAGMILGDGKWSSRKAWAYRYQYGVLINEGDCPVTVKGRFTFDMSNFMPENTVVTNQSAAATGVWRCEDGGRISVTGAGRTLVFRDATDIALDLTLPRASGTVPTIGNVVFCNSTEAEGDVPPTAVTWTISKYADGQQGAVTATGENGRTGPLVASYVVPAGATFDCSQTNGWYAGFSGQTVSNLMFEAGSAYRFAPFAADFAPLAIAGALTLPETMDYDLTPGSRRCYEAFPVIVPEGGIDGSCVWTCRGDSAARPKNARLSVSGGRVLFDYLLPGVLILVR